MTSARRMVPYLGIEWQIQAGMAADHLRDEAIAVKRVFDDSPACKSGIRPGDVIRSVDGSPLNAEQTLASLITSKRPGMVVNLELMRGTRRMTVKVVLGARELPEFKFKPVEQSATQTESLDTYGDGLKVRRQ